MLKVGIIGCGNISDAYLTLATYFGGYKIVACADINSLNADAKASEYGCKSMSVDALLADDSIALVVNLTVPKSHYEISRACLLAGKHVYSEKPYVLSLEEGVELRDIASKNKVRIGSAPDTFLGGSHQRARALIDSDEIGTVVGGACYFQTHGMEDWHPNPDFFYQTGGGPILDMGPYYISNLVQMLGPVKQVVGMSCRPFDHRTISSEPRAGEVLDVEVETTVNGILKFEQGAQITFNSSWDVWASENNLIELHGTKKSMFVPDPNNFGGEVRISDGDQSTSYEPLSTVSALNHEDANGNVVANYRGIGLADMVQAIAQDRDHRCNGDLALHVIDTLNSILISAEQSCFIETTTSCKRPAALPDDLAKLLIVGSA